MRSRNLALSSLAVAGALLFASPSASAQLPVGEPSCDCSGDVVQGSVPFSYAATNGQPITATLYGRSDDVWSPVEVKTLDSVAGGTTRYAFRVNKHMDGYYVEARANSVFQRSVPISDSTCGPPTYVSEASLVALLPASVLLTVLGGWALRRRRRMLA